MPGGRGPRVLATLAAGIFALVGACAPSSGDGGPCTKTANGSGCRKDDDCCSGSCRWQGAGFCQDAKLTPPPCQQAGQGCSQGAHCCSGVCDEAAAACLGTSAPTPGNPLGQPEGGASCKGPGETCAAGSECCVGSCQGGQCLGGSTGGGGGGCRGTGEACTYPAQCCRGLCQANRKCY